EGHLDFQALSEFLERPRARELTLADGVDPLDRVILVGNVDQLDFSARERAAPIDEIERDVDDAAGSAGPSPSALQFRNLAEEIVVSEPGRDGQSPVSREKDAVVAECEEHAFDDRNPMRIFPQIVRIVAQDVARLA